jgi:hypothetical protein
MRGLDGSLYTGPSTRGRIADRARPIKDRLVHWPDLLTGGAIGAAVTVVVGYALLVLQARRAAPCLAFQSSSSPVVTRSEQKVGDLEVRFKGVVVPRLTRTRMAMWNPRWAVVEGADIAERDPLRIGFRDADVLDVRLAKQTREAVSFSAEVRDGDCFIDFDFLDRHDGVILELLHTASDLDRPSIQGTVKGLPAGVSYYGDLNSTSQTRPVRRSEARAGPVAVTVIGLVTGVLLIVSTATEKHKAGAKHAAHWKLYLLGGVLIAVGLIAASFGWSHRLPRTLARARKSDESAPPDDAV